MNFIKNGLEIERKKNELVDSINRGIKLFNKENGKKIPLIYHQDIANIIQMEYFFEEDGLKLEWTEFFHSCNGIDSDEFEQTIPYTYFESGEDPETKAKIKEDKEKRKEIKKSIKRLETEISQTIKEMRELEQDKRDIERIERKYKKERSAFQTTKTIKQDIDREIDKNKGWKIAKEDEKRELEKELK